MKNSHPTIRDVAREAGVSHQTVSRVINGKEDVLPETRSLVENAIEKLGYHPSAIARSMASGETRTLACISPNLIDFTFASVIEGAENEARRHGYFILSASAADTEDFRDLIEELVSHRRVDGLIVINPYIDNRYRFIPKDFPQVFVGSRSHDNLISSVSLNGEKVGYEATKHLISLGHERIAMITGPLKEDCSQDRVMGYRHAMMEAGIAVDESMIIEGDWAATSGQEAFHLFIKRRCVPSAVFSHNDRMALGVLSAAREANLIIPSQLAVIGVDDMPLSSYFDPPLSTMRQDMPRIGREATKILMKILQKKKSTTRVVQLNAQLITRQSTVEGGG